MSESSACAADSAATAASAPGPARAAVVDRCLARLPLLGLYPAAYRAAHGEEIAAVHAETVQGADRRTALREWAALAAHALRLRTRLGSADPAGRIVAGAAPMVLASGAGLSLVYLLLGLLTPDSTFGWGQYAPRQAVGLAQTGPWILALLCASLGRWAPARALVLLGTLTRLAIPLVLHPPRHGEAFAQYHLFLGLWTLFGVLLLSAPPDAVELSRRDRNETVLAALGLALPLTLLPTLNQLPGPERPDAFFDLVTTPALRHLMEASSSWPVAVLSLVLLGRLLARHPDRLRAAGIVLAALPWTFVVAPPYIEQPVLHHDVLFRSAGIVAGLLGTAVLLASAWHALRPTPAQGDPADPAAGRTHPHIHIRIR
ncbi:hypothetical protein GCM10009665_03290 [Kitasatospora nipponensis]|uniref:Alpha-1,2-mannosyltransferase n=1 Tax=Kitasatospora nipponensis TaxID=258049 RepID=A0ABN1VPT7_9ACTN